MLVKDVSCDWERSTPCSPTLVYSHLYLPTLLGEPGEGSWLSAGTEREGVAGPAQGVCKGMYCTYVRACVLCT